MEKRINYFREGTKAGKCVSGAVIGFFKGLVFGSIGIAYGLTFGAFEEYTDSEDD